MSVCKECRQSEPQNLASATRIFSSELRWLEYVKEHVARDEAAINSPSISLVADLDEPSLTTISSSELRWQSYVQKHVLLEMAAQPLEDIKFDQIPKSSSQSTADESDCSNPESLSSVEDDLSGASSSVNDEKRVDLVSMRAAPSASGGNSVVIGGSKPLTWRERAMLRKGKHAGLKSEAVRAKVSSLRSNAPNFVPAVLDLTHVIPEKLSSLNANAPNFIPVALDSTSGIQEQISYLSAGAQDFAPETMQHQPHLPQHEDESGMVLCLVPVSHTPLRAPPGLKQPLRTTARAFIPNSRPMV